MADRPLDEIGTLGPLNDLIGYRLRKAWNEVRRDFEDELGPLGITRGMIGLMSVLHENPGIAQGAAARLLDIQRANMVNLVGEMSGAGWIDKGEDASDRRSITLSLTREGERVFAAALKQVRAHEERMFGCLDSHDRQHLSDMLGMIGRVRKR